MSVKSQFFKLNKEDFDSYLQDLIKIRVFKARFFELAYKAGYWQGQSCPFLNRPIALATLTYP